jgi:hypothetical protein
MAAQSATGDAFFRASAFELCSVGPSTIQQFDDLTNQRTTNSSELAIRRAADDLRLAERSISVGQAGSEASCLTERMGGQRLNESTI